MTNTPKQEEWGGGFDKLWRENGLHLGYANHGDDAIKDFIRSNFLPIETVKREIEEARKYPPSSREIVLDELSRRLFK